MSAGGSDYADMMDKVDQISTVLNAIKKRLIEDGWHEHNAEQAAVAVLNAQGRAS